MNQTYNLEGSQKITVLEVAQGIKEIIGEHVRIEFVPERPGDFGGKEVTGKKAWQELGWKPKVEFEEGLRLTVEWFRQKWGK
jgi:nucleoside-diphosphate-sugar epimerase